METLDLMDILTECKEHVTAMESILLSMHEGKDGPEEGMYMGGYIILDSLQKKLKLLSDSVEQDETMGNTQGKTQ